MAQLQRIMHVDDDATMLRVAAVALQSVAKLEICACSSGEAALAKFSTFNPQLILLDVQMPGLDGRQTLTKLRELNDLTKIAVVFMTASINEDEIKALKEMGAFDLIHKPFEPSALATQVRDIWLAWKAQNGW